MYNQFHNAIVVTCMNHSATNRGIDLIIDYLEECGIDVTVYVFPINARNKALCKADVEGHVYPHIQFFSYYDKVMHSWGRIPTEAVLAWMRRSNTVDFSEYDLVVLESGRDIALLPLIPDTCKLIYRQSDPVDGVLSSNETLASLEYSVIKRADLTLTVSDPIQEKLETLGFERVKLWKNGFRRLECEDVKSPYEPGTLNSFYMGLYKLDYSLLHYVADALPEMTFHIVGPYKEAAHRPNVKFYGYLDSSDYAPMLLYADMAFIPYERDIYKKFGFNFTSKIYQFLAAEIPIVSLGLDSSIVGSIPKCSDFHTYKTADECVEVIKGLISNDFEFIGDFDVGFFEYRTRLNELDAILDLCL